MQFGHTKVVAEIYSRCRSFLTQQNLDGDTPLHVAARGGMFEILNQILKSTASSAHGGSDGQTALHAAVIEKHFEIVEVLLRFKQQLIKETDQPRLLYYAASLGHHRTVQRLLELDLSVAYVLDKDGHSPIHVAAGRGHTSVIREIMRHCPDSGEICDLYGQNALHMAIFGGQANVVRYVLETPELECLMNQPHINGNTPLHLATIERKTWILCYLRWDGRVNQSSKNKSGQTAFDIDRSFKESGMKSPRKWQHIMPNFWGHLGTSHSSLGNIKISPRAEQEEASAVQTYMQMGQTLLMVATLITTVTFSAAFTMPGGYNNDVGPDRGQALLQSNNDFKWFIVTDSIAMTCSIIASCLLFWGAVDSNKSSYVCYFTSAAALTLIALHSTSIAFQTAIKAVMPDHDMEDPTFEKLQVSYWASQYLTFLHREIPPHSAIV
ncbi:PREDICTED: ankyrin repeat-containing protein At3g12360-like [Prunus mume]|nr:PREDICTED: ankyrin repeat-containing protein At3g12360-like [Prunus mume]